jgi:peroxiredoxin Q/BCP
MPKKLKVGDRAPDFTLPDQDGMEHSLIDYRGQWVLLYFYPKDMTPGCTTEACSIRDSRAAFKQQKLVVLGVSADSVKRHKKFADKHELPFTLLSDEGKIMLRSYGVWGKKKFMGHEFEGVMRQSFLIDPDGKISRIYESVKPAQHAQEVLMEHKELINRK